MATATLVPHPDFSKRYCVAGIRYNADCMRMDPVCLLDTDDYVKAVKRFSRCRWPLVHLWTRQPDGSFVYQQRETDMYKRRDV